MTTGQSRDRLIDVMVRSLEKAGLYNHADRAAPVAVLWPDPERLWAGLLPALRSERRVLSLGEYDPENLTGPAIWLRWWIEHESQISGDNAIPFIYLPGVERSELRAVETASAKIKPLVELQFRSTWWQQSNGNPWTPVGFAKSPDGADLNVATGPANRKAIQQSLLEICTMQLDRLEGRQIDAAFVHDLVLPDPEKRLLQWIDAEESTLVPEREWGAFLATCRKKYKLDPVSDGVLIAANKLGSREGPWAQVWERYTEAPNSYPSIPHKLRQARDLAGGLPVYADSWPQDNEDSEAELRALLGSLESLGQAEAVAVIVKAEQEHGPRRRSVWGRLRQTPLADALSGLAQAVAARVAPVPANDFEKFVNWYAKDGALADSGVIDALAAVTDAADRGAVSSAVRSLYLPWIDENARTFQKLVKAHSITSTTGLSATTGDCVLFVDGLRLDVGLKLETDLARSGATVDLRTRIAPIPSMTSSGKPAVAPIKVEVSGGGEFYPSAAGKKLDSAGLKTVMQKEGVQVFPDGEGGDPAGIGWTEAADLDALGHKVGLKLVDQVNREVARIADRARDLLAAGWNRVLIVTDHGWLLMPGGLSKVELDIHSTTARKVRAARLAEHVGSIDQPDYPWTWDASVRVAAPVGVAAFEAGTVYAHGGVSPQESIVPHLIVTASSAKSAVEIVEPKWTGLRCRVDVAEATAGSIMDIRLKAADPTTSITARKEIGLTTVSLLVEEDQYIGVSAFLVVISSGDSIQAQMPVIIGGK